MSGTGRVDRNRGVASTTVVPAPSASEVGGLAAIHRARLVRAMTEMVWEQGAVNVTVAHVVERAGVSRRTFYEIFEDREECFLAALEDAIAWAGRCVFDAYDPGTRWAERIRVALVALLECLDRRRDVGRLLIVESLLGGASALERRQYVLERIVAVIEEGRKESRAGHEPPALTAEGVVGGVLSIIHARLVEDRLGALLGLTGPLMGIVVLPFLGPAAARRELARPAPVAENRLALGGASNPLKELEMRLTYRTVRVLVAVADDPGASNRMVADRAGVDDPGQISKLLGRLERLGLVCNTGLGPGRGASNAWTLTEHGEEVHGALAAQIPAS